MQGSTPEQPWRQMKHPGRRQLGCSCGVMLITWTGGLLLCAIAVAIVGSVAEGDSTEVIIKQAVAALFLAILVFAVGVLAGRAHGVYSMNRRPCPHCGTKPLEQLSEDERLLSCRRCLVTWEVEPPLFPAGEQSTGHSMIDHGPPL